MTKNLAQPLSLAVRRDSDGTRLSISAAGLDGVQCELSITDAERDRLFSQFTQAIELGHAKTLGEAARSVYERLFFEQGNDAGKFLSWLHQQRKQHSEPLVIEMQFNDPGWAVFPFELLHDGQYWWWQIFFFGRRFHTTSDSTITLRVDEVSEQASVVMVFASAADKQSTLKEHLQKERDAIKKQLHKSKLFTQLPIDDFDGSSNEVLAVLNPKNDTAASVLFNCDVFHFAGHTTSSALIVTQTKSFFDEDLLSLAKENRAARLPALIFINGCNGVDPEQGSEMLQTLMRLGKSCIITSISQITPAVSLAMATAFYEQLATGCTPACALYNAKATLYQKRKTIAWAPYLFFGNGEQHIFASANLLLGADLEEAYCQDVVVTCAKKSKFYIEMQARLPEATTLMVQNVEQTATKGEALTKVVARWLSKNPNHRLFLEGPAGAGKSHSVRVIAHYLASNTKPFLEVSLIPVIIELNLMQPGDFAEFKFIKRIKLPNYNRANQAVTPEEWKDFFQRRAKAGKVLFLLDGVNEIDKDVKPDFEAEIDEFLDAHRNCYFLFTSRMADETMARLPDAKNLIRYSLRPLDDEEIESFVRHYYQTNQLALQAANQLIEDLHMKLWELVRNPLILYLVLNLAVAPNSPNFRELATEYDIHEHFFNGIWKHEREKPSNHNDPVREAMLEFGPQFCQELALLMRQQGTVSAVPEKLRMWIIDAAYQDSFLRNLLDQISDNHISAVEKIFDFLISMNLLTQDEDSLELKFWHESFQEYYAARAIILKLETDKTDSRQFAEQMKDWITPEFMFRPFRMALLKLFSKPRVPPRHLELVVNLALLKHPTIDWFLLDVLISLGHDFLSIMQKISDQVLRTSREGDAQDFRVDLFLIPLIMLMREQKAESGSGVQQATAQLSTQEFTTLFEQAVTISSTPQRGRWLLKHYLYHLYAANPPIGVEVLQQLYHPLAWRPLAKARARKILGRAGQADRQLLDLTRFILSCIWLLVTNNIEHRDTLEQPVTQFQKFLALFPPPLMRLTGVVGPSIVSLITRGAKASLPLDKFTEYSAHTVKDFLQLAPTSEAKQRYSKIIKFLDPARTPLDLTALTDSFNDPYLLSHLAATLVFSVHLLSGREPELLNHVPIIFRESGYPAKLWLLLGLSFPFSLDRWPLPQNYGRKIDDQLIALRSYWFEDEQGKKEFLEHKAMRLPSRRSKRQGVFADVFQFYLSSSLLAERRSGGLDRDFGKYYLDKMKTSDDRWTCRLLENLVPFAYYAPNKALALVKKVVQQNRNHFENPDIAETLAMLLAIIKLQKPVEVLQFAYQESNLHNLEYAIVQSVQLPITAAYGNILNIANVWLYSLLRYPACRELIIEIARAATKAQRIYQLYGALTKILTSRFCAPGFKPMDMFSEELPQEPAQERYRLHNRRSDRKWVKQD